MSSYHIQDLRLVLPVLNFGVRVNKHCAKVSALFREWLQEFLHGDVARTEEFSDHRFDLLCSLCFPTIDPPQLLRVSRLCALTFLASDGHIQAETSSSRWAVGYVPPRKACVQGAESLGDTQYFNAIPQPPQSVSLSRRSPFFANRADTRVRTFHACRSRHQYSLTSHRKPAFVVLLVSRDEYTQPSSRPP